MFPIFSPTKILDSLILMQIVREGPLHGYALSLLIEEKFGWKPSQTAIYNSLKSMESENLVTSEEKIEKGRVQKIYSITKEGRKAFEETHKQLRKQMMKNFSQFFSYVQMLGDIENREESIAFQKRIQTILENMKDISRITLFLLRVAPEETQKIVENTLTSLKEIAIKYDVRLHNEENSDD
ncbi:MAG: helix-turn-helix transcriptional regulator [Candidatus Heimdallarchaeota archaeon]|nr:helix-turn-helix transcriptional regulator [Candidatus Heimdallarchaeota archaeon]MBY8995921.1 helix-turn-helix transcriptional regulator [Candidatus Heimdallarchaeota archaeon]